MSLGVHIFLTKPIVYLSDNVTLDFKDERNSYKLTQELTATLPVENNQIFFAKVIQKQLTVCDKEVF